MSEIYPKSRPKSFCSKFYTLIFMSVKEKGPQDLRKTGYVLYQELSLSES